MSKSSKSEQDWKEELTPEQYRVTREAGTEAPYSGKYDQHWDQGSYDSVSAVAIPCLVRTANSTPVVAGPVFILNWRRRMSCSGLTMHKA